MTKDFFDTEALRYLLGEMDSSQRSTFEEQLTRYPAARIALEECADVMSMLRRQAVDLPFFGGAVEKEIARLLQTTRTDAKRQLQQYAHQLRGFITLS